MNNAVLYFLGGIVFAVAIALIGFVGLDRDMDNRTVVETQIPLEQPIPVGTVKIETLPTFTTLNGINVAFTGREEYPQPISGKFASNITVVSFRATGENAYKSVICILWEDGSLEIIPAGTSNLRLNPEKRAKQIIVKGYSVHERKVFRDSGRAGTLNWEIHYQPIK
jgi:hypothetical protein